MIPVEAQPHTAKANLLRRLYDWVLHWAETPYGLPVLALVAFCESSFFPIPPDPLLIALALARPHRAFVYALVCSASSIAGGGLGYLLGWGLWEGVENLFFAYVPGVTPEVFATVQAQYERYSFWAVCSAGFTPIPYKVFTLAAGVFGINFVTFLVASSLSRAARFFLIELLIWQYGILVKRFIERYFNLLSVVFVALVLLGFIIIKVLL
ncbi:hypothetical protein NKDENANG_03104 [Candidatus Entotheonellaceae bacterium PAL068K]